MTSTDGGMAFLGLMLTDMGVQHATLAPFPPNRQFTILTTDGAEHSGVAVYEHGDYCDLEIEEGKTITIAKRDVVAITRSVPGPTAFPASSREDRLRLITVGGKELSGRSASMPGDLPDKFRLVTDDGRFVLVMKKQVLSMTQVLRKA